MSISLDQLSSHTPLTGFTGYFNTYESDIDIFKCLFENNAEEDFFKFDKIKFQYIIYKLLIQNLMLLIVIFLVVL